MAKGVPSSKVPIAELSAKRPVDSRSRSTAISTMPQGWGRSAAVRARTSISSQRSCCWKCWARKNMPSCQTTRLVQVMAAGPFGWPLLCENQAVVSASRKRRVGAVDLQCQLRGAARGDRRFGAPTGLVDVTEQHGDSDKLDALLELARDIAGLAGGEDELLRALAVAAEGLLLALGQCEDIGPLEFGRAVELEQANRDRRRTARCIRVLIGPADYGKRQHGRRRRRGGAARREQRESGQDCAAGRHRSTSVSRACLKACS